MASIVNGIFERDNLSEIRSRVRIIAQDKFKDLIPSGEQLDTDTSSVLGRLLDIFAEANVDIEAVLEYLVGSVDLDNATGTKLDDLCKLGNVSRKISTPSVALLLITGQINTIIPAGSIVKSYITTDTYSTDFDVTLDTNNIYGLQTSLIEGNSLFTVYWSQDGNPNSNVPIVYPVAAGEAINDTAINFVNMINLTTSSLRAKVINGSVIQISFADANNTGSISVTNSSLTNIIKPVESTCTVNGVIETLSHTLTSIQSPILGWVSVDNPFDAIVGSEVESDDDLKLRYQTARAFGANNTMNSLLSDLQRLHGVRYAYIDNNPSNNPSGSLPPHSFSVTVEGGDATQIAQIVLNNTPAGIWSFGDQQFPAYDINGVVHNVYFNRPSLLPITIKISTVTMAGFPTNGFDLIRQAIIDYISSLPVGSDLITSRLYTPANNVLNHDVVSIEISLDGITFSTDNVYTSANQTIVIDPQHIIFGT